MAEKKLKNKKEPSKVKENSKINKNMTFAEVMRQSPEAAEVFFENGMHCMGCAMGVAETVEQGAYAHGVDPDKLVEDINKKIEKSNKTKKK
jgi:hybrid cluster-associated redox disulfide protein